MRSVRVALATGVLLLCGCGGPTATPSTAPSGADPLAGVDWAGQVRDCSREHGGSGLGTVIDSVTTGDVTGDGVPDTVVVDECRASTSSWPQVVEVFEGASDPAHPTRIGTLLDGDPEYLRDAQVSVEPGHRVVVTGKASSPDAPRCCPDLLVRKVFTYSDGRFAQTEATSDPLPPPS